MSLLIKMVEGSLRKSLLQIQKISDPSPVSMELEKLDLKFVPTYANYKQNGILHEMIEKEKANIKEHKHNIQTQLDGRIKNTDDANYEQNTRHEMFEKVKTYFFEPKQNTQKLDQGIENADNERREIENLNETLIEDEKLV
jgi:hypothetical protein